MVKAAREVGPISSVGNESGRAGGAYDFTQIFMVQQDMKNIFRKLDVTSTRLEAGLKKSHDRFYHKCVKHKRDDLIRKVDTFINGHKSEADQRRGKVNQRNSASANYLTPFSTSNQGKK